ncbi:MAG: RNA 2',3'-cyclic phosphodiesterase [Verrucomicrobiota bacterium]
MSDQIRAFFALKPDDEAIQQLLDRIESLKRKGWDRLARFTTADNLHLTLRFLGEVEVETLDKLREGAKTIAAGISQFDYEIGAAILFPRVSRARVIVTKIEAPEELRELNRQLEQNAVDCGLPEEQWSFKPHVTLARLKQGMKRPNLPSYAAPIRQRATEVTLYKSTLNSEGAQYDILESYPLSGQS